MAKLYAYRLVQDMNPIVDARTHSGNRRMLQEIDGERAANERRLQRPRSSPALQQYPEARYRRFHQPPVSSAVPNAVGAADAKWVSTPVATTVQIRHPATVDSIRASRPGISRTSTYLQRGSTAPHLVPDESAGAAGTSLDVANATTASDEGMRKVASESASQTSEEKSDINILGSLKSSGATSATQSAKLIADTNLERRTSQAAHGVESLRSLVPLSWALPSQVSKAAETFDQKLGTTAMRAKRFHFILQQHPGSGTKYEPNERAMRAALREVAATRFVTPVYPNSNAPRTEAEDDYYSDRDNGRRNRTSHRSDARAPI